MTVKEGNVSAPYLNIRVRSTSAASLFVQSVILGFGFALGYRLCWSLVNLLADLPEFIVSIF